MRLGNLLLVVLLVVVGIVGPVTAVQLRTQSQRLCVRRRDARHDARDRGRFRRQLHYFALNHSTLSAPLLTPTLPIAISFFTFMAVSYVVDVYRGTLAVGNAARRRRLPLVLPAPRRGPDRAGLASSSRSCADPGTRTPSTCPGVALIMGGLFKKVVISAYVSSDIVTPVFQPPGAHSAPEVLFAIWGYAIEIYADFSGYTDIAIGIALLLGIRFPVNFDAPYTARSLAGLLAPVAHHAVEVAAGLPVHPARRQPRARRR